MIGREDIQALRIPLIVLGATVIAAIAMVIVSGNYLENAERTRVQRENELRGAPARRRSATGLPRAAA